MSRIGLGPNILTMNQPADHELAWFADIATMNDVLSSLRQRTKSEWVVIPARRNQILLVNTESSESEWSTFLDVIEDAFRYHSVVYPVPHIIVDGCWVERIFDDDRTDVGRRLRRLRVAARKQTYEEIPALLREQTGCEMASFEVMSSDIDDSHSVPETYSIAYVDTNSTATSVPATDLMVFHHDTDSVFVASFSLMERLPRLYQRQEGVYPPRFLVPHPTPEEWRRLQELAL